MDCRVASLLAVTEVRSSDYRKKRLITRLQAIGPSLRGRRQLGHREAAGNWAVIARPQAVAIHVLMRSKRLCKVWLLVRYLQHQFAKVFAIK